MKKLIATAFVCLALVGCKEDGAKFVGVWKSDGKVPETITVTEANGAYRAISKLGNEGMGFMDFEVSLTAESEKLLVSTEKNTRALELADDGSVTSYLRNKPKQFTKVN